MSRDLTKLSPFMQDKATVFKAECAKQGLDVTIICTDRSDAEQEACFAAGNSKCHAGQSAHNAKDSAMNTASEAFDIGVIRHGKYIGDPSDPDYAKAGAIGKAIGLVWAGDWIHFKEVAHFQNPSWKAPH